jgi:hypothetical protein
VLQWTKAPGDNPYHLPVFALSNDQEGTYA